MYTQYLFNYSCSFMNNETLSVSLLSTRHNSLFFVNCLPIQQSSFEKLASFSSASFFKCSLRKKPLSHRNEWHCQAEADLPSYVALVRLG